MALAIEKSEGFKAQTKEEDQKIMRKIASDNYKIFNETNGLEIVTGCLSYGFLDLKNEKKFKAHFEDLDKRNNQKEERELNNVIKEMEESDVSVISLNEVHHAIDEDLNDKCLHNQSSNMLVQDPNISADFADLAEGLENGGQGP